jgi:hypothetical protein
MGSRPVYTTKNKREAHASLEKINAVISIGRGKDYQLGQGVFLSTKPQGNTVADALTFVTEA